MVTELLAVASAKPDDDVVLAAIDAAAEQLGNTRAVCRASYVHPDVLTAAASGHLQELWAASRARTNLRRAEVTLLEIIGS